MSIVDIACYNEDRKNEEELTNRRIEGLGYVLRGIEGEIQMWKNEISQCLEDNDRSGAAKATYALAVCENYRELLQKVWDGTFVEEYTVPADSVYKQ